MFLGLTSLEILLFLKSNDLDRPEFMRKPYQLTFMHHERSFVLCFNDLWKSSLFKGAQMFVFVANLLLISLEVLVFPKSNDPDRHELLIKPY